VDVPLGHVAFARGAPHPALAAHVRRYEGWAERWGRPVTRLEVPSGEVVLILAFGGAFDVDGVRLGAFAGGVYDRTAVVAHDGESAGVQVDLTPLGARTLLGLPLSELTGLCVDVGEVLGRPGRELPERLAGARDWPERFALVDEVLLGRLREARPPHAAVQHAWRRVVASGGQVRVGALAAEVGWSERQLARRFRDAVGLAPKPYARIVRFDRALALLRGSVPPAEAAAACGYADQPHLNRDFRDLAGRSPTALLALASDVGFVQDGAAPPP
jgi:AraC-like DNA-binding protein